MSSLRKRYDELVRDRISDLVEASGEKPVIHVADDTEYQRRLGEKLLEESQEFVLASGYESGGVGEHASKAEPVLTTETVRVGIATASPTNHSRS